MAGTTYQGTEISCVFQGEDDKLNVDMDATANTLYFGWNWYQPFPPPVEPELFPRRLTNDFSLTIKEEKRETNAEDFFVHAIYKITK